MRVFQVGGAVRDRILGKDPKDIDWVVVGATVQDMLRNGFQRVGKDFPVFLHPQTGQEFALARTERKTGQGHTAFSVQTEGVTLEDDLSRRDLTINAMAMDEAGLVIDPFRGQDDLKAGVLRHVGPAFAEDPLRVLRVARFAARFGFKVAPETLDLMRTLVPELKTLTPERVWGEFEKALSTANPWAFFETLRAVGALGMLFPEFAALIDVPQPPKHHPEGDVWTHMGLVVGQVAAMTKDPVTRFGALVHDLGKGVTPKDVLPQHLEHEDGGVPLVEGLCNRFKLPTEFKTFGKLVAEFHTHRHRALDMRPGSVVDLLQRLKVRHSLEQVERFLLACEADARGRGGDFPTRPQPQTDFLRACAKALNGIKAPEGLTGPKVAEHLRQAQCKAVVSIRREFTDTAGMA